MATDYDTPREADKDLAGDDGLNELTEAANRVSRAEAKNTIVADEANLGEDLELPGADLSHESLSVLVLPQQADEFRCTSCFLVVHRSQDTGGSLCTDCAK